MWNPFAQRREQSADSERQRLRHLEQRCNQVEGRLDRLERELSQLREESRCFVNKVGVVRFNPFTDQGGDQSFSVAILDGSDNGVVITSLFARGENRVYSKPIEQRESSYQLTAEEIQAIEQACNTYLYDHDSTNK